MDSSTAQAKLSTTPHEPVRSIPDPFAALEAGVVVVALTVSGVCIAVITRILWIFV